MDMKLNQWIKIVMVAAGVVALTACSTTKKTDDSAIDDANSAYSDAGAESSGLGDDASFGDSAGGRLAGNGKVYYFDYDSNVVRDTDKAAIRSHGAYLASHGGAEVKLEGHTDPRGSREYNIALGERRAQAVAQVLTTKGAEKAQVRVVSYGAEKLASTGRSESDYQQDRRVVLVNLKK
jgi:peptidoglycan-associated lipoprotein